MQNDNRLFSSRRLKVAGYTVAGFTTTGIIGAILSAVGLTFLDPNVRESLLALGLSLPVYVIVSVFISMLFMQLHNKSELRKATDGRLGGRQPELI